MTLKGQVAEDVLEVSSNSQGQLLHNFFERTTARFPNSCAVIHREGSVSYIELEESANQLAHFLMREGVRVGARVGIWLPRCVEQYISILGVLKTGAAYVPIDQSSPIERVHHILSDADVSVLLTNDALSMTDNFETNVVSWDTLHHAISKFPKDRVAISGPSTTSLCYIIYTSGSTGRPKGVMIGHQSIVNYVRAMRQVHPVNSNDRVYQGFTIAFDPSLEEIWLAFSSGATLVMGENIPTAEWMKSQEITVLACVPTFLGMLQDDIPSLRMVLMGGEVCPSHLISRWYKPGRQIFNCYGPTETTVAATCSMCVPNRPITIGKPYPGYEVVLLSEVQEPVEEGEICIGGMSVAAGYVNRDELTRERFIAYPRGSNRRFYRTGDLGRYDDDGNIIFLGRMDAQVKIRGYRIELEEIESILMSYDDIQQAAVNMRSDASGTPALIAHLVTTSLVDETHLLDYLRAALPPYMIPTHVQYVDSIPLLPSGKLDRKGIPDAENPKRLVGHQSLQSGEHPTLWSPLEQQLGDIWKRLLGVDEVGRNQNFFDLGGHSLLAARMFSEIEATFHKLLPVSVIFEADTIAKLAVRLTTDGNDDASLVTMQRGVSTTPIFCIHNVDGELVAYRHFIKHFKGRYSLYGLRYAEDVANSRSTVSEIARHYIQDIRRVHPHGPYVLIGHSMGGIIAYDMARQLHEEGLQVPLLAMIDTTHPDYTFARMSLWRRTVSDLKIARAMPLRARPAFLAMKLRNVLRALVAKPSNVQMDMTRTDRLIHAALPYTPASCGVKVMLFRATEREIDDVILDETLGWGGVATVDVCHVAASHNSMLEEPHVTGIAAQVMNHLVTVST